MTRWWKLFLAWSGLSKSAICEMSTDKVDYHDFMDSCTPDPMHFHVHTCRRCGKQFVI